VSGAFSYHCFIALQEAAKIDLAKPERHLERALGSSGSMQQLTVRETSGSRSCLKIERGGATKTYRFVTATHCGVFDETLQEASETFNEMKQEGRARKFEHG
jgi:hypothetical protein